MAHIRKEIRDDIITTVTGLDTTGKNVFRSRVHPITANKLPAIAVFNKSEEVERVSLYFNTSNIFLSV